MRDNQENTAEAETNQKSRRKIARIILMLLGSIIVISVLMCRQEIKNNRISGRATAEADWLLTEAHGEEVFEVIQNFKSNWTSLETKQNPNIRLELAVTPFLNDYWLATPEPEILCDGSDCGVETTFETTNVRVLEYSAERFKAIACFLNRHFTYERRALYVFINIEDTWKLKGGYDVTIPDDAYRDWEYLPESYQEIIGPLPSSFSCEARPPD